MSACGCFRRGQRHEKARRWSKKYVPPREYWALNSFCSIFCKSLPRRQQTLSCSVTPWRTRCLNFSICLALIFDGCPGLGASNKPFGPSLLKRWIHLRSGLSDMSIRLATCGIVWPWDINFIALRRCRTFPSLCMRISFASSFDVIWYVIFSGLIMNLSKNKVHDDEIDHRCELTWIIIIPHFPLDWVRIFFSQPVQKTTIASNHHHQKTLYCPENKLFLKKAKNSWHSSRFFFISKTHIGRWIYVFRHLF